MPVREGAEVVGRHLSVCRVVQPCIVATLVPSSATRRPARHRSWGPGPAKPKAGFAGRGSSALAAPRRGPSIPARETGLSTTLNRPFDEYLPRRRQTI